MMANVEYQIDRQTLVFRTPLLRTFNYGTHENCHRIRCFNGKNTSDSFMKGDVTGRRVVDGSASLTINEVYRVVRPKLSNRQVEVFSNVTRDVSIFFKDLRIFICPSATRLTRFRTNLLHRYDNEARASKRWRRVNEGNLSTFRRCNSSIIHALRVNCSFFRVRESTFLRRVLVGEYHRERISEYRRLVARFSCERVGANVVRILHRFRSSRANACRRNTFRLLIQSVDLSVINVFCVTRHRSTFKVGTFRKKLRKINAKEGRGFIVTFIMLLTFRVTCNGNLIFKVSNSCFVLRARVGTRTLTREFKYLRRRLLTLYCRSTCVVEWAAVDMQSMETFLRWRGFDRFIRSS